MCRFKCPVCQGDGISLKGKIFAGRWSPAICNLCKARLIPDQGVTTVIFLIGYLLIFCAVYWAVLIKSWLPIVFFFICNQIAVMFIPLVNKDRGKK